MTNYLGWASTFLLMCAFGVNALKYHRMAFLLWIISDLMWMYYDFALIHNPSHGTASLFIIVINIFGWINYGKKSGEK
jgi:hypothetical protein